MTAMTGDRVGVVVGDIVVCGTVIVGMSLLIVSVVVVVVVAVGGRRYGPGEGGCMLHLVTLFAVGGDVEGHLSRAPCLKSRGRTPQRHHPPRHCPPCTSRQRRRMARCHLLSLSFFPFDKIPSAKILSTV